MLTVSCLVIHIAPLYVIVTVSEVHHRSSGSSSKHRSHHISIGVTPLSPRDHTHTHQHHKSKSKSVGATVTTAEHSNVSTLHSNGVHSSHSTPRLSGTGASSSIVSHEGGTSAINNSNKLTPVTSTINHDNGIILKVVYKMHSKRMKLLKVSQALYFKLCSAATAVGKS
jgi:hypothetical protein